jgi:hypothetical protein
MIIGLVKLPTQKWQARGINEHENTLYYEKYQTTDLVFFLRSTQ